MSLSTTCRLVSASLLALAVLAPATLAFAQPTKDELTIYVNEVTTWSPGYAMGDIVLGAPATAGYEPVSGRRQLMLRGKKVGRTTLNIWDQRKTLRHEIMLIVTTREAETVEADLRQLLAPYPNVLISKLGGEMLLTGTVAAQDDLTAVNNIARVARVQSAVRVPSGRSLYKGTVTADIGGEGELFIGGPAVDPKKKNDKGLEDTGIRLTVRPRVGTRGGLVTAVEVETNVPLEYALYDPEVWRRSRYAFTTSEGIPFAVSGNDLLAAPAIAGGRGAMGTVTKGSRVAGSVPGASGKPGLNYVPVFGSLFGSNNYKTKKTQILVVFRPALTAAPQP